jgi:hypothetical protein
MKPAKKKGAAKKDSGAGNEEGKLREEFTNKGPLRLRKYAITGLNIPAEVVDEWNDFNFMVDYCVCKALGNPLPSQDDDGEEGTEENSGEFDASDLVGEDGDGEDDGFDGEMDDDGGGMFADPEEDGEETPDPEPEPEKPKSKIAKRTRKPKKAAPPAEEGDINVQLQGLLDVITNQGVVLDKMSKAVLGQKSTIEEIYVRQEASHKAIAVITKTVFSISTYVSEFVPRALKAMRYKPQATKDIKTKAAEAAKDAEGLVAGLLDPEAD